MLTNQTEPENDHGENTPETNLEKKNWSVFFFVIAFFAVACVYLINKNRVILESKFTFLKSEAAQDTTTIPIQDTIDQQLLHQQEHYNRMVKTINHNGLVKGSDSSRKEY